MPNDQTIRKIAQEEIRNASQNAQYGVKRVPYHTHNNIDSPPIQSQLMVVSGGTTLSSVVDLDFQSGFVVSSGGTGIADISIVRYILYRVLSPTTIEATGTTVGGDLVMPFSGTMTSVGATVDTAGTTGTTQLDINKNGTTILSTKITIDSTEKSSRTAAIPPVISVPSFVTGDIMTFDVDTVQTTPALGLTFFLVATQV